MQLAKQVIGIVFFLITSAQLLAIQDIIKKYHYVYSNEIDTVYYVSTIENNELRDSGRGCLFILNSGKEKVLGSFYFEDAYTFIYHIADYNMDGINEVLTVDMDESYYNISIFQVFDNDEGITIERVFKKDNLFIPQIKIPSAVDNIYEIVEGKGGNIKFIKFFEGRENDKVIKFRVGYDAKEKRFKEM